MSPFFIFRVHADVRLGSGHVARALAILDPLRALGGDACLAISGDERARRVGAGRHPWADRALPCEAVDLGEDPAALLPSSLMARAQVVLVDTWETTAERIQGFRPLRVAVVEDDTDAHEAADLLFQPYLEGVHWPDHPIRQVGGRKVRPYETRHGSCRVLRGSSFLVVDPAAVQLRPRREPLQPLAAHRLLASFGTADGPGLAQRALGILSRMVKEDLWMGTCTLLAPRGVVGEPFPGCTIQEQLPNLTRRIQDFDAVWCAAGLTLAESACQGVPVAAWGQNERQHGMIADLAQAGGCFDLGVGPEADEATTVSALSRWLGPEGQDTRQEQCRDGMRLIDGMGATRIAQELMSLARGL